MISRRAAIAALGAMAAELQGEESAWRIWSPRAELRPTGSQDQVTGELVLKGGGNPAVNGGWEKSFGGVKTGRWYRLTVSYRGKGLTYAPRQVVVRLDWTNPAGKRAGQPEYAFSLTAEGDWNRVRLDAPAPDGASGVKVQLMLLEAPSAEVRWKDVRFTEVQAPTPRPVSIAAIRLRPKGADPVSRFIELAGKSVSEGTDVILLPEGMTVVGTGKKYADVAERVPGPATERLGQLARWKKAWVVAGVYEKEGAAVYNTSVLLDREGRLAGKYRKVYIPREEMEGGITAGSDYPVFVTDFGRVGMMICWDVQYADPARALALDGAELILMPIWGGNESLARARAIENHLYLVTSGYDFPAAIYDPNGEVLARTESDGSVASATVDLTRRHVDQWLGHMRGRFFRELRLDVPVDPKNRP